MNNEQHRRILADKIEHCHKCPGMNQPRKTQAAAGYGSVRSPVVIVGQSLGRPCMTTALLSEYDDVKPLSWQRLVAPETRSPVICIFPFAPHPSWIIRQHNDSLQRRYVAGLAGAAVSFEL